MMTTTSPCISDAQSWGDDLNVAEPHLERQIQSFKPCRIKLKEAKWAALDMMTMVDA
jgi:hypothetical protein